MAMMIPPRLRTARLVLEALGPQHSAGMFELWSHPQVARYSGDAADWASRPIPLPAVSAADSDRIVEFFIRSAAAGRGFRWAMLEGGRFVGALGFNALRPRAELAYHLHPARWGRGLMSEAASAALDWLRTTGATDVEAFIDPANAASGRLARRLGFELTGEGRAGSEQYLLVLAARGTSS